MVTFKLFKVVILTAPLLYIVESSVFTDVVTDSVKRYEKNVMVTQFSCNKKESITLLKNLTLQGHRTNVLPVNTQYIDYAVPANRQIFVLNLHCKNANTLLQTADKLKLFQAPFKWILYSEMENVDDFFSPLNILVDSDVSMCQLKSNGSVLMVKIFKNSYDSNINVEELGIWTKTEGFYAYDIERNVIKRRGNLNKTKLRSSIVITHNDSLNHLTDKRDKHIDSIAKVNYVLVEHLKDIVNATLEYSIQSTWGYKNNKSEWSGMIGELIRNEADIGGTALFFTIDRTDVIDYIAMTTPTRSKFVFRQPKLSYVTNVYILPFDNYVWLSTIFLVIILALVLYGTVKWEWRKIDSRNNKFESYPELNESLLDVILLTIGAVCQQGASAIPSCVPGRITTIMLFVSLMFLYTSYSGNIVALLQSSSNSIRTLEDLLKSRLQVGVDDTVFNRFYFPDATEPVRRAIYLQKVSPRGKKENFMPIEEGVRRMRLGLFAFHMETGPGYKVVGETFEEHEKCGLQEIQFLQVIDPYLAIQKNSSYKKLLKIGLRKIQESGLQSREVGLIYTKKPVCTSRGSSYISVGIVDCYPPAVVLAVGLILSVVIFVVEVYAYYRRNFLNEIKSHLICRGKVEVVETNNYFLPYTN